MAEPFLLPGAVRAGLAARLDGVSRRDLQGYAQTTSQAYRAGKGTDRTITSAAEALAYAVVRMPATYAAVRAALAAAAPHLSGLQLASAVDLGAGSGAGTLAAAAAFDTLTTLTMVEANDHMSGLGAELVKDGSGRTPAVIKRDVAAVAAPLPEADLVLASYVLVELDAARCDAVVARALTAARELVVFVEPGTTAGFARIRAARDVVRRAGWCVVAPCPHDSDCPLAPPDWCHFKVRLPRTRDHMQVKGAAVPFEDEPYSYLVATRDGRSRAAGRVLRDPAVTRGAVRLQVCTQFGVREVTAARGAPDFKSAKKAEAGDPWP